MLRKFTKKRALVALSFVVALAIAGTAFAYFTSTGHGTGSASVGSATSWTVGESATVLPTGGPLYPDGAIGGANVQTDTYTVTNAGSGSQDLSQVVVSVANADGSAWSAQKNANEPACTASDFSVGGEPVGSSWTDASLARDFTANESHDATVTVEMIDNGKNQDNCQGVTVPLYFAAS